MTGARHVAHVLSALGLTAATDAEIPRQVREIQQNASLIQVNLDELAKGEDDRLPKIAWPIASGHQQRQAVAGR